MGLGPTGPMSRRRASRAAFLVSGWGERSGSDESRFMAGSGGLVSLLCFVFLESFN